MAENESMDGKDLAKEEKKKFESRILEAIKNLKVGQTTISIEGIEVANFGNQCTIKLKGITFGIIDKDGKFTYSNVKALKEVLKEEGQTLEDLGLPDLEESIDQEKEQDKEDNTESKNDEEEKSEEEKDDEKPELDDDKKEAIDEKKEEIAKKYNVNAQNVIHISKNKRVTEQETMSQLVNWVGENDDAYIIPGEDSYTYKFVTEKEGKIEEIEAGTNNVIGGKNPDITIKKIDGDIITEVHPIAMYGVDNNASIAIVRDQYGRIESMYCRPEAGDAKQYWGSVIPEASGKNVMQQNHETREFLDYRYNSRFDLEQKSEAFERQSDLEKRGLPSDRQGVQKSEIDGNDKQNRLENLEEVVEELMQKDGITDKSTVPPGYYEHKAEKVLRAMEEDSRLTYDDAINKVEKEGKRETGEENEVDEGELHWSRDPRR